MRQIQKMAGGLREIVADKRDKARKNEHINPDKRLNPALNGRNIELMKREELRIDIEYPENALREQP